MISRLCVASVPDVMSRSPVGSVLSRVGGRGQAPSGTVATLPVVAASWVHLFFFTTFSSRKL